MLRNADDDRGVTRNLAHIAADSAAHGAASRATAHVLHDDEATRDLIRSVVESAGFDSICTSSALDLLLAEPPGPPRLAIVGLTAIDERDLEIVARLRGKWPTAWIVVLHPASMRERAARALALGADASLTEPFYPSEIAALAHRALARTASAPTRVLESSPGPVVSSLPVSEAPSAAGTATPGEARPGAVERLALGVAKSIRGPIEALEQELAAAETEGNLDVAAMRVQLRRITDLADGLTGFAGPPGLELRPADVANLVTGVFVSRDVGAAGAEIGVRLGDARVEILAAPERLRAGLESLRNRAVRVTPPEGRISVRTRNRSENGARMVEISVTDGGPALTEAQRTSLFEPFAEGADAEDATGLDLAALAGIVRAHGGQLLALAAGATGTIVVIRLPIREEVVQPAAEEQPAGA